ncbi:hypothetical protein [Methylomonas sp. AM2-LC]|uniref:hypothetical protein n=1 Tax=Methylomonas sp. AM2-LC TaxID=3153301 RepID=UPI00326670EB
MSKSNTTMYGEELGEKLLESVRQMKDGVWGRKTEFLLQADGKIRRLVTLADGSLVRNEIMTLAYQHTHKY